MSRVSRCVHKLLKVIDFSFWPQQEIPLSSIQFAKSDLLIHMKHLFIIFVLIHFAWKTHRFSFIIFIIYIFHKITPSKDDTENFIDLSVEGAMTEVTRCGLEVFSKRNILSRLLLNLNICTSTTSDVTPLAGVTSSIFFPKHHVNRCIWGPGTLEERELCDWKTKIQFYRTFFLIIHTIYQQCFYYAYFANWSRQHKYYLSLRSFLYIGFFFLYMYIKEPYNFLTLCFYFAKIRGKLKWCIFPFKIIGRALKLLQPLEALELLRTDKKSSPFVLRCHLSFSVTEYMQLVEHVVLDCKKRNMYYIYI